MFIPWLLGSALALAPANPAPLDLSRSGPPFQTRVVVEDFEAYRVGGVPTRWNLIEGRRAVPVSEGANGEREYFRVAEVGGRRVIEAHTRGRSQSIVLRNGAGYRWRLRERPHLSWSWRADHLPAGAREDQTARNDAGLAVLVTFDADLLGRPRSIKYTYSSTLPVGTVVNYGRLRVIVVSSGVRAAEPWVHVRRNVAADFAAVFGGRMPDAPLSITLWSDSDSTDDYARGYVDDLAISS